MMSLSKFLLDGAGSGVYTAPPDIGVLQERAVAGGLAWVVLDLAGVADKAGFLARCDTAFSMPAWFGRNWDALADALEDLSWLPARGCVVHCRNGAEFARHSPADFSTALAILAAAATYWQTRGKLFAVLVDPEAARACRPALPPFPAG